MKNPTTDYRGAKLQDYPHPEVKKDELLLCVIPKRFAKRFTKELQSVWKTLRLGKIMETRDPKVGKVYLVIVKKSEALKKGVIIIDPPNGN